MEDEIERTRELMIGTVSSKGLESCETIDISEKLDALLNEYLLGENWSGDITMSKKNHKSRLK